MGRVDNPVRHVLDYAAERYLARLPIVHILTVIGHEEGGLFIGDGRVCFCSAAHMSLRLNVALVDWPLRKVVVYLPPEQFQSTWLGTKPSIGRGST